MLLAVCVYGDEGAGAGLLCDGATLRDGGLGRGLTATALEALLHLADALLESFELGGGGLHNLLTTHGKEQLLVSLDLFCHNFPILGALVGVPRIGSPMSRQRVWQELRIGVWRKGVTLVEGVACFGSLRKSFREVGLQA